MRINFEASKGVIHVEDQSDFKIHKIIGDKIDRGTERTFFSATDHKGIAYKVVVKDRDLDGRVDRDEVQVIVSDHGLDTFYGYDVLKPDYDYTTAYTRKLHVTDGVVSKDAIDKMYTDMQANLANPKYRTDGQPNALPTDPVAAKKLILEELDRWSPRAENHFIPAELVGMLINLQEKGGLSRQEARDLIIPQIVACLPGKKT